MSMSNFWAISVLRYYQVIVTLEWKRSDRYGSTNQENHLPKQKSQPQCFHSDAISTQKRWWKRTPRSSVNLGREVMNGGVYLLTSEDCRVQSAMLLQARLSSMGKYTLIGKANEILKQYDLTNLTTLEQELNLETPITIVASLRKAQQKVKDKLSRLRSAYSEQVKRPETDQKSKYAWLT